MMNISALLEAAEYLERRERGPVYPEHGYASLLPSDLCLNKKYHKARKSQGTRTSHNELEKNRRAHLRHCLERLKEIVPLGPESHRHTTLGLLTKAKVFIKTLEDRERKHQYQKEHLFNEQRYLRKQLEHISVQLQAAGADIETILPPLSNPQPHFRSLLKRRTVSEGSTSAVSSSSSSSSSYTSESDDFEMPDYQSHGSDSDELSSSGHSSLPSLLGIE